MHTLRPETGANPEVVLASLSSLVARPDHVFRPDSVSLLDGSVHTERLLASSQVTDTYLLHLAASHDAQLATFDTLACAPGLRGAFRARHAVPGGVSCTPGAPNPPRTRIEQDRGSAVSAMATRM